MKPLPAGTGAHLQNDPLLPPNKEAAAMTTVFASVRSWNDIQQTINTCSKCQCQIGVLFDQFVGPFGRPPEPAQGGILFISHAPPPKGGFWTDPEDSLRKTLFELLGLPNGDDGLKEFEQRKFSLIQTFKRPLRIDLSGLPPGKIRPLSEHTSKEHVKEEIEFMRPRAIMALGAVAASALSWVFADSEVGKKFAEKRVTSVKGERFEIELSSNRVQVWATYLPAGQRTRNKEKIRPDVKQFLESCGR